MMWNKYMWGAGDWGIPNFWMGFLFPLVVLDLVLKGFALYRSARNDQKIWFIFLLFINSAGILPAIYLLTHKEKSSKKR